MTDFIGLLMIASKVFADVSWHFSIKLQAWKTEVRIEKITTNGINATVQIS